VLSGDQVRELLERIGVRSAGAHAVSDALRLLFGAWALAVVLAACTNGEQAEGDLRSAPIVSQSFEVPTSTPVPTRAPTATPMPTATSTTTPEPTPTPTGEERYGPLLVPGQYNWPLQMPAGLSEDELLAINIFASWQNARYASYAASDASSPEVESIRPYVGDELIRQHGEAVAHFRDRGELGSVPQSDHAWINVQIADRLLGELVLKTCEHVDTVVTDVTSGSENREFGTSFRRIEYLFSDKTVQLVGWVPEMVESGEFTCTS